MSRPPARASIQDALIVSTTSAVLFGAADAAMVVFKQLVLGRIAFVGVDYLWMIPAASLLFLVPVVLVGYAAFLLVRGRPTVPSLTGAVVALVVFAALLPHTAVVWWASGLLAAGVGAQVVRLGNRIDLSRWMRRLARLAAVVAVVLASAGTVVRIGRGVPERAELETLPALKDKPNVLLIVLDTVRNQNLSVYGYDRPTTPNLERLASESVVFDWAMATAPWTLPSHASMFTGLGGAETETSWLYPLPQGPPTLAETLANQGYATGGFVANLEYTSHESGLNRGFAHYSGYQATLNSLIRHTKFTQLDLRHRLPGVHSLKEAWSALFTSHLPPTGLNPSDEFRPATRVAEEFLEWRKTTGNRPFFAFLNLFDAHSPYFAPERFLRQFDPNGLKRQEDLYDASIAWLDEVVARLLEPLRADGSLDNTIVIVTADHGEHLGDHGIVDHANSLYLQTLRVPLLIRYPAAVPAGRRVGTTVSLRDLPATVLDLIRLNEPVLPGNSLAACWRGPEPVIWGDVVAYLRQGINVGDTDGHAAGDMFARFSERLHYIRDGQGEEKLYAYRTDPLEVNDLADRPEFVQELARLRAGASRK